MYNVSEAYKTEMRQEVRNFSYMKIKFGVTDPDALRYGYVSATSSKLAYSSEPDLVDEKNVFLYLRFRETPEKGNPVPLVDVLGRYNNE